ncbi:MAG: Inner rane protein yebE [Rubritepida sp.]|nr:Inner rane protein yebE [Rubritepida sp.]
MDFGRILGAVLSGAAQRPRTRTTRSGAGPFGMNQTQTRQVGRVLGTLATIAMEALSKRATPSPASDERPRMPPRRIPDIAPREPPAQIEFAASAEAAESHLMLRAMIAAARSDDAVDKAERAAIAAQLDAAGLSPAERDRVLADFDHPADIEELAAAARDPMLAAQLYAAAFAAAGELSAPERAWLDRLAIALKLDGAAKTAIEHRLGG